MKRSRQLRVKQRDITDCGPACIASVAAYYDTFLSVSQLRQIAGTDQKGTSAFGLIKAFESVGMNAKGIRCSAENLDKIPLPAIAHVVLENKMHHYLVIYGISRKKIRVMDPSSGKLEMRSLESFFKLWTGIIIISAPGGEYKPVGLKISNRKRFLYLIRPHKAVLFQAIIGALLYTLLGFSTSIYIQKLTDYIIVFQLKQALHISGVLMLVLIVFQQVFSAVKNSMILRTGQLIDARLILGYYKHLLQLPQLFFDSMRVGEIISRINDAGKIRQFLSDTSINVILNILIMVFSVLILFLFHWKLALIVSLILPAYAIIYCISNYLNRKQERLLMEKSAELESQLVESIQNIRTVKQLNLEGVMSNEVEWRFIDLLKAGFKSGSNSIFASVSSESITRIFTLALLWIGAVLIFKNELTIGQMLSFYTILGYMSGPASRLIGINKIYQNANIAADRLFEIMDLQKPKDNSNVVSKDFLKQDIEFRNIDFSYGTRGELFTNFNMLIPGGKVCAIIGESGSGKSSIANLIIGLYEIGSGSITIGKHKISHYSKETLSRCIAIVPQHTDLFAGSILQNIAPGEINPDTELAMDICYRLGLQSFLHSLPEGINTLVGEKGFALSGGERQRISIARALYRNPSILILDEATSSLDRESEAKVLKLVNEEKDAGRTVIIISHRLHSIKEADKIILLKEGQVLEQGDHNSLKSLGGHYGRLLKEHGISHLE